MFGFADVLAHVPAEGVYGFGLAGVWVDDVDGFVADAAEGAAGAFGVVGCDGVVVAELHENEVAGLCLFEDVGPAVFGAEGSAAASADGAVVDDDFVEVEVLCDDFAPADAVVVAVFDGGVADDPEGGFGGIGGVVLGGGCAGGGV